MDVARGALIIQYVQERRTIGFYPIRSGVTPKCSCLNLYEIDYESKRVLVGIEGDASDPCWCNLFKTGDDDWPFFQFVEANCNLGNFVRVFYEKPGEEIPF